MDSTRGKYKQNIKQVPLVVWKKSTLTFNTDIWIYQEKHDFMMIYLSSDSIY